MKRVLITGANSYIGMSFETYAKAHYVDSFEIDTIDMQNSSWRETDFSKYDVVFHVAGIAHADVGNVSDEVKKRYYAINTDLAIETAKKAKDEGVKQFVFMSSMIIYGESAPYGKQKVITADTKPEPANFYGDSKLQADIGVKKLQSEKFSVSVIRPPMIYGKGSKGNYPILAKLAKKLPVFPNIDNQRSMLHIDNLCELLCQIMILQKDGVFFPQNEEYVKTSDMVEYIAEVNGKKIVITSLLNPFVWLASKVPGKVGGLVNKAFGSCCYQQNMSMCEELKYSVCSFRESIQKTELVDIKNVCGEMVGDDGLVSIIMPAYNAEKYIAMSINSVINQIYQNWELIIVDDCSSDNTSSVIANFLENKKIKLINHEHNAGSAAARNTAIEHAKGRYIAFLDADDLWNPEKLDKQIAFMRENDYSFTFTGYETFLSEEKAICVFEVPDKITYNQYLKNTIIGNLTVVMDRWKINDVHIEYGQLEDVLTWMFYLKKGYIAYGLNIPLAKYRTYPESKSGNKFRNAKRYYDCLRKYQNLSLFKSIYCEIAYLYNATVKRILGRKR